MSEHKSAQVQNQKVAPFQSHNKISRRARAGIFNSCDTIQEVRSSRP